MILSFSIHMLCENLRKHPFTSLSLFIANPLTPCGTVLRHAEVRRSLFDPAARLHLARGATLHPAGVSFEHEISLRP